MRVCQREGEQMPDSIRTHKTHTQTLTLSSFLAMRNSQVTPACLSIIYCTKMLMRIMLKGSSTRLMRRVYKKSDKLEGQSIPVLWSF